MNLLLLIIIITLREAILSNNHFGPAILCKAATTTI